MKEYGAMPARETAVREAERSVAVRGTYDAIVAGGGLGGVAAAALKRS